MLENIAGSSADPMGCPKLDSRELLAIYREGECDNYWYSQNAFSDRRITDKKKYEIREFSGTRVAPTWFVCPCKPGEPIDATRGGVVTTVGFAEYKSWVSLDPCEVFEEIVFPDDDTPFDRLSYDEKFRRHIAAKTVLLGQSTNVRYELMSSMVKYWGSYIIEGPKMDPRLVDFQRNPCLTVVMKKNFDEVDTFVMQELIALDRHFKGATKGKIPRRYTFGQDAWNCVLQHHEIQKKVISACECTEPGNNILAGTGDVCGIEFVGQLNGKPVYVDTRTYRGHDGREHFYQPQDSLLIESAGMGGVRAHSTIHSPSAGFRSGDFHYRQWFCEPDEVWNLEIMGSILMLPQDVNTAMLVRNIGPAMSCPDDACVDRLINAEGEVYSPTAESCWDGLDAQEISEAVGGDTYFNVCAALLGRTDPRVPCANPMQECVPGKTCLITPRTNGCPGAQLRVISKETLESQGFDDADIAAMIKYGGLGRSLDEAGEYVDPPEEALQKWQVSVDTVNAGVAPTEAAADAVAKTSSRSKKS